jgi:hypothetical protein
MIFKPSLSEQRLLVRHCLLVIYTIGETGVEVKRLIQHVGTCRYSPDPSSWIAIKSVNRGKSNTNIMMAELAFMVSFS